MCFGVDLTIHLNLKFKSLSNLNKAIIISIKENNWLIAAIIGGLPAEEIATEAKKFEFFFFQKYNDSRIVQNFIV